KRTRKTSPRSGSRKPRAVGSVPPATLPPGIASPPVSRFATLNASAATRTIARNRSRGTAHSVRPRHGRITTVRRRRALITISRTAAGNGTSRDAELLEELLPPLLADEPQGEGDQAGDDGQDERDAREGDRPAERPGCLVRRRGSVHRRGSDNAGRAGRNYQERANRRDGLLMVSLPFGRGLTFGL